MCGFIFSCCFGEAHHHSPSALEFIAQRGPDSLNIIRRAISGHPILLSDGKGTSKLNLTVAASVLSLRGTDIVSQPLSDDETGSFLCWNGEAWKTGGREVLGNDSETIFSSLLDAVKYPKPEQHGKQYLEATADDVGIILGSVEGPFSFLFYDGLSHRVFYGRDELGRRSLLINNNADSGIIISSVSSEPGPWTEVEAKGIFTIDLATEAASHGILPQVPQITPSKSFLPSLIPWSAVKTVWLPMTFQFYTWPYYRKKELTMS